jgi:TRAP-type C4-dicarboxylate transport system permease small subunit
MAGIWQQLENGAWLPVERARACSLILLALAILIFAGWIAMSDDVIDRNGNQWEPTFPTSMPPAG